MTFSNRCGSSLVANSNDGLKRMSRLKLHNAVAHDEGVMREMTEKKTRRRRAARSKKKDKTVAEAASC